MHTIIQKGGRGWSHQHSEHLQHSFWFHTRYIHSHLPWALCCEACSLTFFFYTFRDLPISWHVLSLCMTVLYWSAPLPPLFTQTPRLTRSFKSNYSILCLISKSAYPSTSSYGWSLESDTGLSCISPRICGGNMWLWHTLQQVRLRGLKDSLVFITQFPSILSSQGRSVLSAGASLQGSPVPVIHPLSPLISAKARAMSRLVTRFVPVGPTAVTHGFF